MTITLAIIGNLAAISVGAYSEHINKTKFVPCYGDISILKLEYSADLHTTVYSSAADLKDDLLTEFKYTKVTDGVYQCPSCDDCVYANVSINDDKLVTSCSLDEDATVSDETVEQVDDIKKVIDGFLMLLM